MYHTVIKILKKSIVNQFDENFVYKGKYPATNLNFYKALYNYKNERNSFTEQQQA